MTEKAEKTRIQIQVNPKESLKNPKERHSKELAVDNQSAPSRQSTKRTKSNPNDWYQLTFLMGPVIPSIQNQNKAKIKPKQHWNTQRGGPHFTTINKKLKKQKKKMTNVDG